MDSTDVAATCCAIFHTSFWAQRDRSDSLASELLSAPRKIHPLPTPPPAHTSVPTDLGITTHLFSRMGVYGTPEAGRNRAGF